jgi:hypothetical protein
VKTSKIITANEYTPINPHLLGWAVKPKPKTLVRKELVKKNEKTVWAREGFHTETIHSGDLLSAMQEETDNQLARHRFPNQEDFKDSERRVGKRMLHTAFIKRVLAMNKNLIYEDSKGVKGSGAFYLVRNSPAGPEKIYTGACFRKGWMPEWTIMKTDAADLPTQDGLTYGYRTVLQRLLQKGAITYRQVVAVFGEVHRNDLCGKNWLLNTQHFRM